MPDGNVLDAAVRLKSVVDQAIGYLSSRDDEALMPRALAAAALARNNRLFGAMVTLQEASYPDACGIPTRPMIENVLVGLYALYGGPDAYKKVQGAYVGTTGTLHEAIGVGRGLEAAWTGPTRDLNWEQLSRAVGEALADRGEVESGALFKKTIYDSQYRAKTANAMHGGIGSLGGHIDRAGGVINIKHVRGENDDGMVDLLLTAALHATFGRLVFVEFGISIAEVDRLRDRLLEDFETLAERIIEERTRKLFG